SVNISMGNELSSDQYDAMAGRGGATNDFGIATANDFGIRAHCKKRIFIPDRWVSIRAGRPGSVQSSLPRKRDSRADDGSTALDPRRRGGEEVRARGDKHEG